MRYRELVQIRATPEQKAGWTHAAHIRRQSLSTFTRACVDAGAATRLKQSDLLRHFREFRRLLNAAAGSIDANNRAASSEAVNQALKLLRKLQTGD